MSWNLHHSRSEQLAAEAEIAVHAGDALRARALYKEAAEAEERAFAELTAEKHRTRGVTAISSVALWYKGRQYTGAEQAAYRYLSSGDLPTFAQDHLRDLLSLVWTARAADVAGVRFVSGDVLVSVKGGQVIHGGAPLDLIVRKVEGIQAVLLRTVEMLLERPLRRRGGPPADILSMFRPWLFQAPAGSYQFAVRVQEPQQQELWESARPQVERVTKTFFRILRASAGDAEAELPTVVSDPQYREAFLSLSRNLAPTGGSFEWLEVRDAADPADVIASFGSDTRQQINTVLRKEKATRAATATDVLSAISGVLRAVHLDQDWLEVVTNDAPPVHLRIEEAGEALDDVVGPMVNRRVTVTALHRGIKYLYRDIELEE